MKLSTFVLFILIASGVFYTFALIIYEGNENIDGNYLNSSEWEEEYDYIDDVNETFAPLEGKLKAISDEDTGWWGKLTAGITAIPYAVLIVPQSIFGSLVFGSSITVGFLTLLVIPATIISLATVYLIIWGIFKLIEFYNKTEI